MQKLVLALTLVCAQSHVDAAPIAFPDGAVAPSAAELKDAISGRTFNVIQANGLDWKWQFLVDGRFVIYAGSVFDDGKWSTLDGELCTQRRELKAKCNEARLVGTEFYLMRDGGEVIRLTPK